MLKSMPQCKLTNVITIALASVTDAKCLWIMHYEVISKVIHSVITSAAEVISTLHKERNLTVRKMILNKNNWHSSWRCLTTAIIQHWISRPLQQERQRLEINILNDPVWSIWLICCFSTKWCHPTNSIAAIPWIIQLIRLPGIYNSSACIC